MAGHRRMNVSSAPKATHQQKQLHVVEFWLFSTQLFYGRCYPSASVGVVSVPGDAASIESQDGGWGEAPCRRRHMPCNSVGWPATALSVGQEGVVHGCDLLSLDA